MRLAENPKGLVGSGWSTYAPRRVPHWDPTRATAGETTLSIGVEFDVLNENPVIDHVDLARAPFDALPTWTPQSSGVELPADLAGQLEAEWITRTTVSGSGAVLSQAPVASTFTEGALRLVTVNAYERDPRARRACVNHYGATCHICGFSFGKAYGPILEGFIHVHHLRPLAEIGQNYAVNPIDDLRPVCPNCHAALHHRRTPYNIQELKEMIAGNAESA
ncbi:MAG: HNH endonuclease [Planctomycetaceae bacterium]|nr:HNH endonuclease [Planctomycetaceae bacterium]